MKRVILSIILFIFAGVMGLAVFCPLASFQKVAVSTGEVVEDLGQNATTLYFVESIFVNDDDMEKAKQNLIAKDIELGLSELSINDREIERLNCAEKNRYDVYNFAKVENLSTTYLGVDSSLQNQMKIVSGLTFAYFISAGIVTLLSLLSILFNSHKLRGFGTLFTFLTLLLSVAMVLTTELVLKTTEATFGIIASVKWTGYMIVAYVGVYMLLRLILNRKIKKM
ncbi:MAG: hypothetical protein ACI4L1_02270 [Christensenellales bacterium]